MTRTRLPDKSRVFLYHGVRFKKTGEARFMPPTQGFELTNFIWEGLDLKDCDIYKDNSPSRDLSESEIKQIENSSNSPFR